MTSKRPRGRVSSGRLEAMRAAAAYLRDQTRRCWRALRYAAGDDAYERYLAHHAARHADAPVLDRRAFYMDRQQRKWSGVQRCC